MGGSLHVNYRDSGWEFVCDSSLIVPLNVSGIFDSESVAGVIAMQEYKF